MAKITAMIDGSIYTESVCQHAAWLATRRSATVEVIHVQGRRESTDRPANLSGNITLGARTALLDELAELDAERAKIAQKHGRLLLQDAKTTIEGLGIAEVTTTLRLGDLVETVEALSTDALVMGKRGAAADFAKLHLGSNLERVLRSAQQPVLVAARAFKPINKVLIAFDGGPASLKAIDQLSRDPAFSGLSMQCLSVGTKTAETLRQLDNAKATLAAAGHDATSEVEPGQPDRVIARRVEEDGIDLLVMGSYGHSRLRSLFIGSTTSEMIRSCKIPILLFR